MKPHYSKQILITEILEFVHKNVPLYLLHMYSHHTEVIVITNINNEIKHNMTKINNWWQVKPVGYFWAILKK